MTFNEETLLLRQLDDAPVVFVEDDPDYAALFSAHAERLGLKAVVIENSMNVVPALIKTRHRAKLLVTDLQMPTLDGLDIAKELKAIGSATQISIITNQPTSKRAREAQSLGYDVRQKPMSVAEFRDLLAPVLDPGQAPKIMRPEEVPSPDDAR